MKRLGSPGGHLGGTKWPPPQAAFTQAALSPEAARKELGTFLGLIPSNSRLGCLEEKSILGLAGRFQVMMADDAGERVPESTHVGYVGSPRGGGSGGRGGGAELGPSGSALRLASHQ